MENINSQKKMEMQPAGPNSFRWQKQQQRAEEMRKRYGEAKKFLDVFTPELQTLAAREWEKAYTGLAPHLSVVSHGYGADTAIVWLCLQLENINLFAGVKEKMPVNRQKELAGLILTEYGHLKITELLLFFHRLKCGRYGRFYGSVDALTISSSLLQFMDERKRELALIAEKQEKTSQQQPPSPTAISYAEYLALKQKQTVKQKGTGGSDE